MSKKPPTSEPADAKASAPAGGADIDALLSQAQSSKKQASRPAPRGKSVRQLWQGPALMLGAALFVSGVVAAFATKPDFDTQAALASVEALVESGQGEAALAALNGKLLEKLGMSEAPAADRERFHRARAAAMYLEMRSKGLQTPENYRRVLEELATLEELGAELEAGEVARSIEARLALGENDEAIRLVNRIDPEDAERRRRMLKLVIRAAMDDLDEATSGASPERFEQTLSLLTSLASDPTLDERDRIWTIARQAELRLAAGYNSETIAHLLREMQRIDRLNSEEAGELFVLLGRAYFNLGQYDEAAQRLGQADTTLSPTDEHRATANVLLGRIAMTHGDAEAARERFAFVTTAFGSAEGVDEAWLGLAESEAALGNFDQAAEAYEVLVENLLRNPEEPEHGHAVASAHAPDPAHADPHAPAHGAPASEAHGPPAQMSLTARLTDSLRDLAADRLDREDPVATVRFARIAEHLSPDSKAVVRWASLLQARAHRTQADSLAQTAAPDGDMHRLDEADPVTLRDLKTRYLAAADEYRRHAMAVIGTDDKAYGESLWNAADSADLAGDRARAIKWFGEFVNGRPSDARRDSARFRIATAHQANSELEPAINLYRDLIASNPSSGEGYRSYVPLARCLLQDGDPATDLEAENLLRKVLGGSIVSPDAPEFRVALDELGGYLVKAKRFPEAIARLSESLDRFPDSPDGLLVRYQLAEALRLSGAEIAQQLTHAMPESQRRELERLRRDRLRQAMAEYEQVALRRNAPLDTHISGVEENAIRNAFFFRADCAFDLGEYDRAIEFYDAAAQRFSDDPATLVAMVQIVNAYAATDRWSEARTAHERARQRFRELPPEAFDRSDLPMDRRHWERWLDSVAELAIRDER